MPKANSGTGPFNMGEAGITSLSNQSGDKNTPRPANRRGLYLHSAFKSNSLTTLQKALGTDSQHNWGGFHRESITYPCRMTERQLTSPTHIKEA